MILMNFKYMTICMGTETRNIYTGFVLKCPVLIIWQIINRYIYLLLFQEQKNFRVYN